MQTKLLTLIYILLFPIYLLSILFPKKKNLVVIGGSLGKHFADNPKYLFLYLNQNKPNFQYYWITKNKELYREMGANNFLYLYTFKGIYILLRSKYLVLSHQINDMFPPLHGGKEIIQLWHGTPLKKLGFDRDAELNSPLKNRLKSIFYFIFPYLFYMRTDYIVVSAECLINNFSTAFKLEKSKVIPLGQPRNDILLQPGLLNEKYTNNKKFLHELSNYEKVISWLPTHRHGTNKNIVNLLDDYEFDAIKVNQRLKQENSILIIKPHFIELGIIKDKLKGHSNIVVYEEADPYPLLTFTDVLITDYSSVFFDFYLTKRDIIFAPFDYHEYKKNFKDFYYDYDDLLSEYLKANNWNELLNLVWSQEYFNKSKEYKKLQDFNKYTDENCKRVTEFIETLCK